MPKPTNPIINLQNVSVTFQSNDHPLTPSTKLTYKSIRATSMASLVTQGPAKALWFAQSTSFKSQPQAPLRSVTASFNSLLMLN